MFYYCILNNLLILFEFFLKKIGACVFWAPVFFLSLLAGKFTQFAQSFPCQFCYQKHLKEYPLELKTNMTGYDPMFDLASEKLH